MPDNWQGRPAGKNDPVHRALPADDQPHGADRAAMAYEIKHDGFCRRSRPLHLQTGRRAGAGVLAERPQLDRPGSADRRWSCYIHSRQPRRLAAGGHYLFEARSADQRCTGAGSTIVLEDPSGAACIPVGDCPCGLSAGVPPVVASSGPVLPCGWFWPCAPSAVRRIAGQSIAGLTFLRRSSSRQYRP
jgi:hypothetical protein